MERATGNWAAVAGGLVLAYFLSPPLLAWVMMRLGMNDMGPVMRLFYAPAIQVYEHFPPYKSLMDAMFKALGVS